MRVVGLLCIDVSAVLSVRDWKSDLLGVCLGLGMV